MSRFDVSSGVGIQASGAREEGRAESEGVWRVRSCWGVRWLSVCARLFRRAAAGLEVELRASDQRASDREAKGETRAPAPLTTDREGGSWNRVECNVCRYCTKRSRRTRANSKDRWIAIAIDSYKRRAIRVVGCKRRGDSTSRVSERARERESGGGRLEVCNEAHDERPDREKQRERPNLKQMQMMVRDRRRRERWSECDDDSGRERGYDVRTRLPE